MVLRRAEATRKSFLIHDSQKRFLVRRRFTMKKYSIVAMIAVAGILFGASLGLCYQTTQVVGKIHGKDAQPLADAQIVFTDVSSSRIYKAKTDRSGQFSMIGIAPGSYQIEIVGSSGQSLYQVKRQLGADAAANQIDIDLSKLPQSDAL